MVDCVWVWEAREARVGAGLCASAVVSGRRVVHLEAIESVGVEVALDLMLLARFREGIGL